METYFQSDPNNNNNYISDFQSDENYSEGSEIGGSFDDPPFIPLDKFDESPPEPSSVFSSYPDNFSSSPESGSPPSHPNTPPDKQSSQIYPHKPVISFDTSKGPPRNPTSALDCKSQHLLNNESPYSPIFHQNIQVKPQFCNFCSTSALMPSFCFTQANIRSVNLPIFFQPTAFYQCPQHNYYCCNASPIGCNSGSPSSETIKRICDQINSVDQMKAYLQRKITGRSETRFNKKTLHYMYNLFAQIFGWGSLTRTEKRNKKYVFKRFYDNKVQVLEYIQNCPSIIDQVLLAKGFSKLKNSQQ